MAKDASVVLANPLEAMRNLNSPEAVRELIFEISHHSHRVNKHCTTHRELARSKMNRYKAYSPTQSGYNKWGRETGL